MDIPAVYLVDSSLGSVCDSIDVTLDRIGGYSHLICSTPVTGDGARQAFINRFSKLHGFPNSVITDKAPKLFRLFWSEFIA